tara:strand:+ start:1772 stop:2425 length:654 start_codon:yes stop_codon:yes gene_type:complete
MQTVIDTIRKQRGEQQADMLIIHGSEVSELESKGENIPQKGGGPGRGIFQYELTSDGGSGAAKDALVRYKRFYSDEGYGGVMPENYAKELEGVDMKNPDFTKLSPELQTEIFYADKEQKEKFPLDALGTDAFTLEDAWLDQHWVGNGDEKEKNNKRDYYNKTMGFSEPNQQELNANNDEAILLQAKKNASQVVAKNFNIFNIMNDLGQDFEEFKEEK